MLLNFTGYEKPMLIEVLSEEVSSLSLRSKLSQTLNKLINTNQELLRFKY